MKPRMHSVVRSFGALTVVAAAVVGVACGGSDSGSIGGSSGSSPGGSSSTGGDSADGAADTASRVTVSNDECMKRCSASARACASEPSQIDQYCKDVVCKSSVTAAQLTCNDALTCDAKVRGDFPTACPADVSEPTADCGGVTCTEGQYCALTYDPATASWGPGACDLLPSGCGGLYGFCDCMKSKVCPTDVAVDFSCAAGKEALKFGCRSKD